MFRRFPRLISPRSVPWHENPFYGKCFASATIGILGTFYLSRQIIYGDAPDEDDDHDWPWSKSSKLPDVFYPTSYDNKLPHDPSSEATPYRTLSCTIDDNPGIARVDATCVPKSVKSGLFIVIFFYRCLLALSPAGTLSESLALT
jgi:hypothetical protein